MLTVCEINANALVHVAKQVKHYTNMVCLFDTIHILHQGLLFSHHVYIANCITMYMVVRIRFLQTKFVSMNDYRVRVEQQQILRR